MKCRLQVILIFPACLMLGLAGNAGADQDEAWLVRAPLPASTRPLLVIVLDTSAAMSQRILVAEPFDPLTDYARMTGGTRPCNPQRVYWRRGPGPAPDCTLMAGIPMTSTTALAGMQCDSARGALERHGLFVASRAAQWNPAGRHWDALRADSTDAVACRSDAAAPAIDWNAAPHGSAYIFYTGNFLNYLAAAGRTTESTLAAIAAKAITIAADATSELDVAVFRTSDREPDAEGGFVLLAPVSAAFAAARLPTLLAGLPAAGAAPIGETMTEVVAWLSGGSVRYGDEARADVAVRNPQDTARYQSPFSSPCRPVTIAVATAGIPSQDDGAQFIADEPGFTELTGGCDANCLPAIAQWLTQSDLLADQPGQQFAPLNWFTPAPIPALVAKSLDRAGGQVEFAGDPLAFANVIARSLQHDAAVAATEQLSAAGLLLSDQSTHEPAVLYGLSAPQIRQRWFGNLLRYGLRAPAVPLEAPIVVDRDGQPAFDPDSGLPRQDSCSVWSNRPDGNALLSGGAAGQLPAAESRRLFSDITADALTSARNRLTPGNTSLSAATLGLSPGARETPANVISWLLNLQTLGDPGLQAPVSLNQAGPAGHTTFIATHDGLLHAFDSDTGVERWAFMPRPLLSRLPELMRDEESIVRSHGIDGPLVLHRYDPNGDGRIDPAAGEHLWLLFGIGRGGVGYYALDLSSPDEPRLIWSLGTTDLGDAAESWPEPVIARLSIANSGQDRGAWVVVLAGGYDRAYDFPGQPVAASGALLSILDAASGRRLWRAAGSAALLPDQRIPAMTASFASAPRVLDLDGDGYADRIYAITVDGSLWRMDLQNGATAASLALTRQVAQLGGLGRRFYSTPDVAMVREGGRLQPAISMGSGWRARPREATITDRFYSIRDREPASATLREADLHDATAGLVPMPAGAPGWFVRLDAHGAGEKVIGSTLSFDHRLHFVTYQPTAASASSVCGPPQAVRRLRTLDIRTGLPANRIKLPGDPDEKELPASGLPPAVRFAFPGPWEGACADCRARPFGLAGTEIFDAGFGNDPVRTSWRKLPNEPASP